MCPGFIRFYMSSLLLATWLCASASAGAQTYAAGFSDAQWTTKSGAFACSLNHQIPGFGQAQFVRNTGSGEFLELRSTGRAILTDSVKIEAVPPVWRNEVGVSQLGEIKVASGQSLRIPAAQLARIRATLEQGTSVVFSGTASGVNGQRPRVTLEARNFNAAYDKYQACVGALIPYTFNQIARTRINYAPDANQLSDATKRQLDKIIRYTKADPKVLGILVDAHSDALAAPEEAEAASQQQAELVTAYLVSKGLSEEKIKTRWHGDKFPIANNQNKAGQAKNRRITVRMENEATRNQMEQKIAAFVAAEEKAAAKKAAEAKAAEEKAGQQVAQESIAPPALPVSLQQLEQLVEQQDITNGWQPLSR